MRIAIDATPLLLRSAGVKNYIYHWLTHLRRGAGSDSIATFPFLTGIGELDHEHSMTGRLATFTGLGLLHGLNRSRAPWAVPGLDLFHASHQCLNPPRRAKLTTTIHDMTCWLTPAFHSRANVEHTQRFAAQIMTRADGIIADSESTRRDVLSILDLDPQRVEVIYPGVPESFFSVTAADVHRVRDKYGLSRPYVLCLGTIEPRKNIPGLLAAYDKLSPSTREEYELVLAGPLGWADRETVERIRSAAGVRQLGYLPRPICPP